MAEAGSVEDMPLSNAPDMLVPHPRDPCAHTAVVCDQSIAVKITSQGGVR